MRPIPSLQERFNDILRILDAQPPSHDINEALTIVSDTFDKAEKQMPGHRMYVRGLSAFKEIDHAGKKIHADHYKRHVLLLGDNGSIEIRLVNRTYVPSPDLAHPYADLELIFEKSGADVKKV
jgi:hypothetical protein